MKIFALAAALIHSNEAPKPTQNKESIEQTHAIEDEKEGISITSPKSNKPYLKRCSKKYRSSLNKLVPSSDEIETQG